jgi:hypothetical protein
VKRRVARQHALAEVNERQVQESLTLDYKGVSAFANSAGGQIIYGVEEKDRKPTRVDKGTDVTREWIEQVIDSNVQPRVEGLVILPIHINAGRNAYVLEIPPATARAPHQAPDKKYYKRQNFQSVPMEDYEIRDALRRGTTPKLQLKLRFAAGESVGVEFSDERTEFSKPIGIVVEIINESSQPAYHAFVEVGVDADLALRTTNNFYQTGTRGDLYWLCHRFSSPPALPIFKEIDPVNNHRLTFTIAVPRSLLRESLCYLATSIQTPGYTATDRWVIHSRGGILRMCPPGHPMNR